ncbi:MAG: AI-2E family transporter [Thermoanaerobacterium sp.]|nr:AI-2E family transporter [Thermoanaerobacterium sp.]
MRISKKYMTYIIWIILAFIILYFFYKNIDKIKEVLFPVFVSIILAYFINPIVTLIESKGIKRVHSIIFVYFLLMIVAALFIIFIFPVIVSEMSNLFKMIPDYISLLTYKINNIKNDYLSYLPKEFNKIFVKRANMFNKQIELVIDKAMQSIILMTGHLVNLILSPIITFYLLKDKEVLKNGINEFIPQKMRGSFLKILKDIDYVLSNYIRSQIYISLIVTVLTSIGLMILKVKYSLLIGILAGILNVIPYFGPILGSIPAVVMGLMDSFYKGVWSFVIFFLVQQIESAVIAPKIMSDNVDLHPITVIIALLVGEQFFGILGMLLSVPVVAIAKVILKDIFLEV